MWGVIPAAGLGSRIQPLAFSKELLPVGSRLEGNVEHPRAISEYLIERMVLAGASKLCFVISPGKSDILEYYGGMVHSASICYTVQPKATGLCDAIFRALPFISPDEQIIVGLPDTLWLPREALRSLPDGHFSFLLFPVSEPHLFDAVVTDEWNHVLEIQVKQPAPSTSWIWGAFKLRGDVLRDLYQLWSERNCEDHYIGTLVNAYLAEGGTASGVRAGRSYVDVGTLHGYREALKMLSVESEEKVLQVFP
jgi:glucose-1-phosphate thymidylyltransferase